MKLPPGFEPTKPYKVKIKNLDSPRCGKIGEVIAEKKDPVGTNHWVEFDDHHRIGMGADEFEKIQLVKQARKNFGLHKFTEKGVKLEVTMTVYAELGFLKMLHDKKTPTIKVLPEVDKAISFVQPINVRSSVAKTFDGSYCAITLSDLLD